MAIWQTGLDGLNWLKELVGTKRVIELGGNGYPYRFTAQAQHVLPLILSGPPKAHPTWSVGEGDILLENWAGKTVINHAAAEQCSPGEWLLIEAWDES